jgi:hypothetical protein
MKTWLLMAVMIGFGASTACAAGHGEYQDPYRSSHTITLAQNSAGCTRAAEAALRRLRELVTRVSSLSLVRYRRNYYSVPTTYRACARLRA